LITFVIYYKFTIVMGDDFIKKLEYILEYYALSASNFADKIGVQRSSLSHLLSGRNKPSLDFILKIREHFPLINLYWLLENKGSFLMENETQLGASNSKNELQNLNLDEKKEAFNDSKSQYEALEKSTHLNQISASIFASNNAVDKIIVLYKNGTFENYNPK
jgi:plasmid maintenance system antidote protein VapI